jgi:mannose-6-phosphate isomerase-like protein (cupin superfamily)
MIRPLINSEFDVGAALKLKREQAGLSQRQLAELAELTHVTIANVESNRSAPSVATLARILDVLKLTFSEFFTPNLPSMDKVFYRKGEFVPLASGDCEILQVGPGRGVAKLQVIKTRYRPGAETGPEMLKHEAEEGGVILSGEIELTVGDRTEILGPGDGYLFRSNQPHRFRNVGDTDCTIVAACTPPYL